MSDLNHCNKIIIMLGGSFNPPTIAHKALMEHAMSIIMDQTGQAVTGVYVPSSHSYVARKMSKDRSGTGQVLFSEAERVGLLDADCCSALMDISDIEYGDDGRGHTYQTLCELQKQYPMSRVMFLAGADKLKIIPKWRDAGRLLSEFTVCVTCRDEDDTEKLIKADPFLNAHIGSFWLIPELPGNYKNISSTAARKAILDNDMTELIKICGYKTAVLAMDFMDRKNK